MRIILLIAACLALSGVLRAETISSAEELSQAEEAREALARGTRIVGLGGGVSLGTRRFGGDQTYDLAVAQLLHGVIVTDLLAEDRVWSGRVVLAGEFIFAREYGSGNSVLFGATPLVRYLVETDTRFKPFVGAGVGFAWTDIGEPRLGGKLQFSPQAGAGFYWFLSRTWAIEAEHRLVHYSNGGMRSPNGGINQHHFLLGMTRFY